MQEDKNHQQVDWGNCMDDWDSKDWDDPNGYGLGEDCAHESDDEVDEDVKLLRANEKERVDRWSAIEDGAEYSKNWKYTSYDLRERHNYQCQKCYAILSKRKKLLHVHHKNRCKQDNRISNLIVLCVLCHAEEERHSHLLHKIDQVDVDYIKQQRKNAKPLEPKKKFKIFADKDDEYWEEMDDLYPNYPK